MKNSMEDGGRALLDKNGEASCHLPHLFKQNETERRLRENGVNGKLR